MVGNAFTANSFLGAGFISAVAFFKILFPITFHGFFLPELG